MINGRNMSNLLSYRLLVAVLSATLCGNVLAQAGGGADKTEFKDGLPVGSDPGASVTATIPGPPVVNDPGVTVTATVAKTGFVFAPTGNSLADLGHAYVTASKTPSAIRANSKDPCDRYARPILPDSGAKVETYELFSLPGEMGLSYTLYYNTASPYQWSDNLSYLLDTKCNYDGNPGSGNNCESVKFYRPDGSSILFSGDPDSGPFTEQGGGGLATLTYDAASATYTVHDETGMTETFGGNGENITGLKDASGVGWTINTTVVNGVETRIATHTNGQSFSVVTGPDTESVVNGHPTVVEPVVVTDPAGNAYSLNITNSEYDKISFPGSPATVITFKYGATGKTGKLATSLLTEVDYNGTPYDYTSYVSTTTDPYYGWANGNYLADNTEGTYITYSTDQAGNVQAVISNSLGHQTTQTYDGTNGSSGAYNSELSLISDTALATCSATAHGRSYDANGNLAETIDNNGYVHTYTYAVNGQLQTETEAYGTPLARTTDYVWDPNQQLNRPLSKTVEGWNKTTYTYNAQNRVASTTVTNLSGKGSANQSLTTTYNYTLYGNGMVQSMTVTSPSPNGSNTTTSHYDALGNLTSVSNGLGQTTSYSNYNALGLVGHVVGPNGDTTDYTYDARGRVSTKTTYPNGAAATWSYTYDGFGLLYTTTGPDGQVTTWNRDPSSMRVNTITHNDKDGTSTESFSYDANGDVLEHKIARGSVVGLDEVFHYDALGRVYQKLGQNGQLLTYAYDGNGNVLSTTDAVGHSVVNQYDALNRVTQTMESGGGSPAMPASAPALSVPSSSSTGGYTVSWNSITGATFYILQEQVNGGAWGNVQSSSAISWAPTSKANNTYGYRAQACNATGCGPWSNVGSIVVSVPMAPTGTPSLTVPSSSANGNYTVSWTAVANTSAYTLQEQLNGGAWNTIQNSTSLSWSVNGKTNGTYAYRSQACNALGCGPWSNTGTMVVTWPAVPAVPTINVPARNYSGSYTVSWSGVANAASYPLYQSVNGGAWTLVQNNASTSWTASGEGDGQYNYLVSACDISGCSSQSGGGAVVVIPTPIAAVNGQTFVAIRTLVKGSGNEGIGIDIAGGNTWELFKTAVSNGHVVVVSGGVPYGAATVQYTWTDAGVPSGDTDAAGSITNPASSPVAISSNPSTQYVTSTFTNTGSHAHRYNLRVDFFDSAGSNISSSTCVLNAEVMSAQ